MQVPSQRKDIKAPDVELDIEAPDDDAFTPAEDEVGKEREKASAGNGANGSDPLKETIESTLGDGDKLEAKRLEEVAEILRARGHDGTKRDQVLDALKLSHELDTARREAELPSLSTKAAMALVKAKEETKVPTYKEAAVVVAVKQLGDFGTYAEARRHMQDVELTQSEILSYRELLASGKVSEKGVGKLVRLDAETRETMISLLEKKEGEKPYLSPKQIEAMLSIEPVELKEIFARQTRLEAFRKFKEEAVTPELLQKLGRMSVDEINQRMPLVETLDGSVQRRALNLAPGDIQARLQFEKFVNAALGDKVEPGFRSKLFAVDASAFSHISAAIRNSKMSAQMAYELIANLGGSNSFFPICRALSLGGLDEKNARALLKVNPLELRESMVELIDSASMKLDQSKTLIELANAGKLNKETLTIYRDLCLRRMANADWVIKALSLTDGSRAIVEELARAGFQGKLPEASRLNAEGFAALVDENLSTEGLKAIRDGLMSGGLTNDALAGISKASPGYRAIADSLLRMGVSDRAVLDEIGKHKLHFDLMKQCVDAQKKGLLDVATVTSLLKAPDEVKDAFRLTVLPGELAAANPRLDQETIKQIIEKGGSAKTVSSYYKAVESGALSKADVLRVLALPQESRQSFDKALNDGLLDGQAVRDLLRGTPSASEIDRYAAVVSDAKRAGISLDQVHEAAEYIELSHLNGSESGARNTPVDRAELALVMRLEGLDPLNPDDIQKAQKKLSESESFRTSLKLGIREALLVHDIKRDSPDFPIDQKTFETVRAIEKLASFHIDLKRTPMSARDAIITASILNECKLDPNVTNIIETVALKDTILKLRATHPELSLKEAERIAGLQRDFFELIQKKSDFPIEKLKLEHLNDSEMLRLELDKYAAERQKEATGWLDRAAYPRDRKDRDDVRSEQYKWQRIGGALLEDRAGPILADMITAQPHLAWQVLKATDPEKLKDLPSERFGDLLKSVTRERLNELPDTERAKLARALVRDAKTHWEKGIPDERRAEFVKSWIETASLLPGEITEARPAYFEILRSLKPQDLSGLSNDNFKRLVSSMARSRMDSLPEKEQARLLIELLRETNNPAREAVLEATFKQIMTQLKPELINHLPIEDVRWLSDEIAKRLKNEPGLEGVRTTAELARAIADRKSGPLPSRQALDRLIDRLPAEDRALALELMKERAEHLSEEGLIENLKDLARDLKSKGFIRTEYPAENRGRPTEAVTVACFGESTQARALAWQLRKHTGLKVDVKVLKEGDPVPEGKVVLLDPLSKAPESLRGQLASAENVYKPASLLSFREGLNYRHLAAMTTDAAIAQGELTRMLDDAKKNGRKAAENADATGKLTDAEYGSLTRAIEAANGNQRDRTEAKTLLFFHDHQKKRGGPVQLHAMVLNEGIDYLREEKLIESAWELNQRLMEGEGDFKKVADPSKVYYIVETRPDSNNYVADLHQTANGIDPSKYVTMEQAKALAKQDGVTFVYLNDGVYSGEQAIKNMERLAQLKELSGGKARVITASLFGYSDGIVATEEAGSKLGVENMTVETYQDVYKYTLEQLEAKKLTRHLSERLTAELPEGVTNAEEYHVREMLGDRELSAWSNRPDAEVTRAGVKIPRVVSASMQTNMRSNSTAEHAGTLADYQGIPRAHNESRAEAFEADALAAGKGGRDLAARRAEMRQLLSPLDTRSTESYLKTMNEAFEDYVANIETAEDMRFVLEEGVARFLDRDAEFTEAMGFKDKRVEIRFSDEPAPPAVKEGTIVVTLDPSLKDPTNYNKARTEILRQLLTERASVLFGAEGVEAVDRPILKEALDLVVADKMASMERPLVALEPVRGIRNLTRVSDLFIVGGAPSKSGSLGPEQALSRLKDMGVQVIIDVRKEANAAEQAWCRENGVEYLHMPLNSGTMTHEQMDAILKRIAEENGRGRKVYLHCQFCRDRAPSVVASWRMAQGLSHETAYAEMRERFHYTPSDSTRGVTRLLPEREGRQVAPEVRAAALGQPVAVAPVEVGTTGTAPLRKGSAPGLGPNAANPGRVEVATGGADIKTTEGGGYEVTGQQKPGGRQGEVRTEEMTKEQLAKLRRETEMDRTKSAEERANTLRTIELAEAGDVKAREALRSAMQRCKAKGGGFDAATGSFVGIGLFLSVISAWYISERVNSTPDPYSPKATVG